MGARGWLCAATVGVAALAAPALALAADPVPVGQVSLTCNDGDRGVRFNTTAAPAGDGALTMHRAQLVRAPGGSAYWTMGSVGSHMWDGDVAWSQGDRNDDMFPYIGSLGSECGPSARLEANVTSYAIPSPPTAFSGRVSRTGDSTLKVALPGRAPYEADLKMQGGAITADFRRDFDYPRWHESLDERKLVSRTALSPETIRLGAIDAGFLSIQVTSANGAAVSWTVAVRALPVPIWFSLSAPPAMTPGAAVAFPLTVEGDTGIAARVVDGAGAVVRDLGFFPAGPGNHAIHWDGRDAFARDVPDGTYRIVADSGDPSGQRSSVEHTVAVDSTPPVISISTTPIRPNEAMSLSISDPTTAVATRMVLWNNASADSAINWGPDSVGRLRPDTGRFDVGLHRISVTSQNAVGKEAKRTASVRVVGSPLTAPRLRARKGTVQVGALSGVSGAKQVQLRRGKRIVGRCSTSAAAGKRFTCRARVAKHSRGKRVQVRIIATSKQTGKRHVMNRAVRTR